MADIKFDPVTGLIITDPPITSDTPSTDSFIPPAPTTPPPVVTLPPAVHGTPALSKSAPVTSGAMVGSMGVKDTDIKETLKSALEAITIGERLFLKREDIINIFKTHGMDTMSQKKAWDELMSVLTLEG